jgi:hypothetical protein
VERQEKYKRMKNRLRGGEENNLAEGNDSSFGIYQIFPQLAFLVG